MNVFIVYTHHEPTSFTSAMKNVATEVLTSQQHNVVISDLYGQGFNPVAQKWDFITTSGGHFNYMLEQRHAAKLDMAFSPDVVGEIQKLQAAELVIFVTPIWWFSVPAILKGWFDRVLAMGVAWDSGKIYEAGLMRGKQAMISGAAGGPTQYYQEEGKHKSTTEQNLHSINHGTLAFCGFNVHEQFVALDVLGTDEQLRTKALQDLQFRIEHMLDSPQWHTFYGVSYNQ
jgi:NAD(P)H dehydrogenase (quinone)